MIVPSSLNNECSALICVLHNLAVKYKYTAYRKKQFPELVSFFLTQPHYSIPKMSRAIRKEINCIKLDYFGYDYKFVEYKSVLNDFNEYLFKTYSNEYPELLI